MKNLSLILFLFKVLVLSKATKFSNEYDITTALNDTIARIFLTVQPQNINKIISSVVNYDDVGPNATPYKYFVNYTLLRLVFCTSYSNLEITNTSSNLPYVSYGFSSDQIQLHIPQFTVHLSGGYKKDEYPEKHFSTVMRFSKCTITTIRNSNISGDSFLIDMEYDYVNIKSQVQPAELSSFEENLQRNLRSILRTHMNRNAKLLHSMGELHNKLSQSFLDQEHLCYYFITNLPFGSFNLRDIVVNGLSNFYSINSTIKYDNMLTYILLMKDIRGSMVLEGADKTQTLILELSYFVDSLSIFVTHDTNRISLKAENYCIVDTKSNTSLTTLPSDIMMDQLERAIGSSLMPSMEFQGTNRMSNFLSRNELENIITRLLTEKSNPIPHTTRISTDDKNLPTNLPQTIINNYYHISFPNLTIMYFVPGNQPHPEQIQCPLFDNSQFTHRINVSPTGKVLQNKDHANSTSIDFHINSPSLNVSIINKNNSKAKDSCEFQIINDQDIKVQFPSKNTSIGSNKELLKITNKIDTTLMSMAKKRFVQTIKSMACFPFEVCTQSAKLVNNFFSHFVDDVLKKCSFERIVKAPNNQSEELLDS